jgi:hypothetical protein
MRGARDVVRSMNILSRYRFDDHEERDDQFGNSFPYAVMTSIQ